MASNAQDSMELQLQPKLRIYSTSSTGVSPFWKEKYEKDAKKYWDVFYKRHQDKFFKDRHYLDKEWGHFFSGGERKVILEVGCGAGNTLFPLVATYPEVFVHACDFSPRAVDLVKMHKNFTEARVSAFVCDLTVDELSQQISPSSVDIVTMCPLRRCPQFCKTSEKFSSQMVICCSVTMPLVTLLRKDSLAKIKRSVRTSMSERAFYFSDAFLTSLFKENGFEVEELGLCCKQIENRSREIVMNRRWVQAAFRILDDVNSSITESAIKVDLLCGENIKPEVKNTMEEPPNEFEVDMSEGLAIEMFGISNSTDEIIEVNLRDCSFKINTLPKEYQHTCKSTGLMLWESAHLMASVLAENPTIVAGKRVLELGCGCGGICSMVAVRSAGLLVATDGDTKALDMLSQNIASNLMPPLLDKLITKKLEWGNRDDIEGIKELNNTGFEVIIGTDVTYIPEAILPLFATAKDLISSNRGMGENEEPAALILCHVFRRVDEPSILSAASQFGFRLVDKWPSGSSTNPSQSIISSWFSQNNSEGYFTNTPLNIMYFSQSSHF